MMKCHSVGLLVSHVKLPLPPVTDPVPTVCMASMFCGVPVVLHDAGGPTGSFLQVEEQPSPLVVLPSSHCSPVSTVPLPQVAGGGSVKFVWAVAPEDSPVALSVNARPRSASPSNAWLFVKLPSAPAFEM